MPFGRYKDLPIDKIPNSYLRWVVGQPNMPDYVKIEANKKLEKSDHDDTDIEISRHAIDMFSKRFLNKWTNQNIGFGTFVAHSALEALIKGLVVGDERKIGKGVKIYFDDIVWVFGWDSNFPQYKNLITVMSVSPRLKKEINEGKHNELSDAFVEILNTINRFQAKTDS